MNTNKPMNATSLDEYEDLAVKNSNNAKRIAAGAAAVIGAAAIGGGATYAATTTGTPEMPITEDNIMAGADVATAYQDEVEQTETKVVKVEAQPQPEPQPEPEPEPQVSFEEEKNYYINGEKVMSVESGKIEGHNFDIIDSDGNGKANILLVDTNDNGTYEDNETIEVSDSDNIIMGHNASHTTNHYIVNSENILAEGGEGDIKNDFTDEKTGEEYHDDFAENNPDYNPNGFEEPTLVCGDDIPNDDDIFLA